MNSCNYWYSKTSGTIRYDPQSTEGIWNHPESTRNYSLHRNSSPLHSATSHQILPCFSPCWLWTIRKVELRKNVKDLTMIVNHKGICGPFLTIFEITLKQVYNILFEWDCITYKCINVFKFQYLFLLIYQSNILVLTGF